MFRYRHPDVRQEEDEWPWGRVVLAFLGTLVIGGVLTLWAWVAMTSREAQLRPSGAFPEQHLGPRRDVGMVEEELYGGVRPGQQLVEAQREELGRFGVVDRDKGIVTIPIDAAIELLVGGSKR